MTDIIARLRKEAHSYNGYARGALAREAADEIERLRAVLHDVERLTDERGGYPGPSDALRAIGRIVAR